jgi:hypothetical protein
MISLCTYYEEHMMAPNLFQLDRYEECVWERGANRVPKKFNFFFFLLKFNMVCTFWIVLMCWCQKWFLKNKKTSLACISAQKVIWKATATTLPSTLELYLIKIDLFGTSYSSFHSNFENRIPFLLLGLLLPHLALFFLLLEMNSMGSSADLVAP